MRSDAFILNQKQQVSGLKRNVFRLDEFGEWERKCSRCELLEISATNATFTRHALAFPRKPV